MEIQNNTGENVVYEAKDGPGGGIPYPILKFLLDAEQVFNELGCAGVLPWNTQTTLPTQIVDHNPASLVIYRLVPVSLIGQGNVDPKHLDATKTYNINWQNQTTKDTIIVSE